MYRSLRKLYIKPIRNRLSVRVVNYIVGYLTFCLSNIGTFARNTYSKLISQLLILRKARSPLRGIQRHSVIYLIRIYRCKRDLLSFPLTGVTSRYLYLYPAYAVQIDLYPRMGATCPDIDPRTRNGIR